ncbi:hypothetical protein HBI56_057230 [Parastagonospora nodorum]|uniref:MARVEL domain-containing protein n=1 Tax=Phaeosphaeria nodorum (strain SN15 / ATCC MYA-4574 / FGSC 10173) TaxID=321614 RepID=A0A7U2NQU7_PHANO|nr:hypothetical protein HBH56_094890 [Parastagonospora nodorum]QRD07125.1 hypothetical protein JI435_123260 [Parastagonospora nodorum SN15]KAH3930200.1 hypothetical protein HBH54_109210 [Parastagonospora nodorum]KAH3944988.1 hypothetical protein HBH53_150210 [Parastagonospora nodorum]KAH3981402.1 hypothetical protein HBH52_082670 [Parastagonospora nodorum]
MPGPLLNFTIFTKSTPHALRAISLATFVPAFIILLIAGIGLEAANPAIGIIPLFFSSAFSALLLANEKKCGCQASGLTGTPVHLVFDLALGLSLLMFTILGWLSMGSGYADRGFIVLGTYGTNFMAFNFIVHFYFVGLQVQESLNPGQSYPMSCPQCQNSSFSVGNIKLANVTAGLKDGYAPLLDREGEPRTSVEDRAPTEDGEIV